MASGTFTPITSKSKILVVVLALCIAAAPAMGEVPDHQLSKAIERAKAATVGILRHVEDSPSQATQRHFSVRGTGVHIRDGYILTASHAVKGTERGKPVIPNNITVLTEDLQELPAVLTGVNAFLDIAVYQVNHQEGTSRLGSISFGDTDPEPGEEVFTVGYPLGWGPALGFGRIGNPNTFLPTVQSRLMQIDLSACSGNSGGGLFNVRGEIVGVVHAIIQTETTQGERRCSRFAFAVPGPLVHRIATALIQGRHPEFPKLGIQMTAVKKGTQWRVAVGKATGPARKGGLRKGDILLSIEETAITSPGQLKNYLIERTTPGQRVAIRILRGQNEKLLHVILGKS